MKEPEFEPALPDSKAHVLSSCGSQRGGGVSGEKGKLEKPCPTREETGGARKGNMGTRWEGGVGSRCGTHTQERSKIVRSQLESSQGTLPPLS